MFTLKVKNNTIHCTFYTSVPTLVPIVDIVYKSNRFYEVGTFKKNHTEGLIIYMAEIKN
jgi:hypothetical protein